MRLKCLRSCFSRLSMILQGPGMPAEARSTGSYGRLRLRGREAGGRTTWCPTVPGTRVRDLRGLVDKGDVVDHLDVWDLVRRCEGMQGVQAIQPETGKSRGLRVMGKRKGRPSVPSEHVIEYASIIGRGTQETRDGTNFRIRLS